MARRYVEMVIDGPRGWDVGFIRGFLRGRGMGGLVIHAEEEGFECEPLREKLRQLFHPGGDTVHLLVPEEAVPVVREAVGESAPAGCAMAVHHEREVAGARFRYRAEIFSREHGARIRKMLEEPGGDLKVLPETAWEERTDPRAKGPELYAPVHDYELRGHGGVEGDLEEVLGLYRRCREEELLRLEKAELIPAQ